MKKLFLCSILAIICGSCETSTFIASDIECFDSCIKEQDGYFIKLLNLGERPFSLKIDELTRKKNQYHIKGVILDNVNQDTIPYPCLYQISPDGHRYKIEKKLCMGNMSGIFDCRFERSHQMDSLRIVIDAVGYQGAAYIITDKS